MKSKFMQRLEDAQKRANKSNPYFNKVKQIEVIVRSFESLKGFYENLDDYLTTEDRNENTDMMLMGVVGILKEHVSSMEMMDINEEIKQIEEIINK